MRFIILSVPGVCQDCGRFIRATRGAFWDAGILHCVHCVKETRGEVPQTAEEMQLVAEQLLRGRVE